MRNQIQPCQALCGLSYAVLTAVHSAFGLLSPWKVHSSIRWRCVNDASNEHPIRSSPRLATLNRELAREDLEVLKALPRLASQVHLGQEWYFILHGHVSTCI